MLATKYDKTFELECINCHQRVEFDKSITGCPRCGENILEARYDLSQLDVQHWLDDLKKRPSGLWRYHEVLPIHDLNNVISLGEGERLAGIERIEEPELEEVEKAEELED